MSLKSRLLFLLLLYNSNMATILIFKIVSTTLEHENNESNDENNNDVDKNEDN